MGDVSLFALVNAVRQRTAQLADGAPPVVDIENPVDYDYPVRIAMRELEADKLRIAPRAGPVRPPAPPREKSDLERLAPGLLLPEPSPFEKTRKEARRRSA